MGPGLVGDCGGEQGDVTACRLRYHLRTPTHEHRSKQPPLSLRAAVPSETRARSAVRGAVRGAMRGAMRMHHFSFAPS